MKISLEIITPVKTVLSEEVDEITIPTIDGEISILPGHINLFTKINPGEMIVRNKGTQEPFAVMGGFIEVLNNRVTVLADYAVRAEDIEIAKAKEAEDRAKRTMENKENRKEFAVAEADLKKALLELKVAQKHKSSKIR